MPWWTDSSGTHGGRRNHLCLQSYSKCLPSRVAWATRCDRLLAVLTPLDRRRVPSRLRIRNIAHHSDLATIQGPNALVVASWDTHKFAAPNRTHLSLSDRTGGSTGRMDHSDVMEDPHRERNIGRDLTHTGLYVIDSDHASSLTVIPDIHPENSFASTHWGGSITDLITGHSVQLPTRVADIQTSATGGEVTERGLIQDRIGSANTESSPVDELTERSPIQDGEESAETDFSPEVRLPVIPTINEDPLRYEDPVMQISGTGHWFLEGWIGDHSVEFLVNSGSSVTAMSDTFYRTLVHAGAPLGTLQYTARNYAAQMKLALKCWDAHTARCHFWVSEFPIIICNLATGTDAIIGTDVLGSVLPHTTHF